MIEYTQMSCDRKCGISCPFFTPIDQSLINFIASSFGREDVPKEGQGTCEFDLTATPRDNGALCAYPNANQIPEE